MEMDFISRRALPLALAGALAISGCAGVSPPAQPTPASIESTLAALQAITADPVTAWQAGDYAVRASCHAYLNASAQRNANLSLGVGALGLGGAAAAGMGSPAAAGAVALASSFLTLFQQSGAIPYTEGTSTLIENALNAYEAGVTNAPPATVEQAASYVDDLWFLCSPGGYAELMQKAAMGASVSSGGSAPVAHARMSLPVTQSRPVIQVNGL